MLCGAYSTPTFTGSCQCPRVHQNTRNAQKAGFPLRPHDKTDVFERVSFSPAVLPRVGRRYHLQACRGLGRSYLYAAIAHAAHVTHCCYRHAVKLVKRLRAKAEKEKREYTYIYTWYEYLVYIFSQSAAHLATKKVTCSQKGAMGVLKSRARLPLAHAWRYV